MEVPILIAGEKAGKLSMERDGLYTVFEARLPPDGALTRLWVAGNRQSGYLGLMEPRAEERYLCRRLTSAQLKQLPATIEHACTEEPAAEQLLAGQPAGDAAPEQAPEPDAPPPEEGERDADPDGQPQPEPKATGPPAAEDAPPEGQGAEEQGLLWFSRPDGSLTAFDGLSRLIALPACLRQTSPGVRLVHISGRDYMVFRC